MFLPWATPPPSNTRSPSARQRSTNSKQRRLLPTPASATTPTTWPLPSRARASAASQGLHVVVAADEARQAAGARGVEARAHRAEPLELEDRAPAR